MYIRISQAAKILCATRGDIMRFVNQGVLPPTKNIKGIMCVEKKSVFDVLVWRIERGLIPNRKIHIQVTCSQCNSSFIKNKKFKGRIPCVCGEIIDMHLCKNCLKKHMEVLC